MTIGKYNLPSGSTSWHCAECGEKAAPGSLCETGEGYESADGICDRCWHAKVSSGDLTCASYCESPYHEVARKGLTMDQARDIITCWVSGQTPRVPGDIIASTTVGGNAEDYGWLHEAEPNELRSAITLHPGYKWAFEDEDAE